MRRLCDEDGRSTGGDWWLGGCVHLHGVVGETIGGGGPGFVYRAEGAGDDV
jgi:hypothetical protein